MNQVLQELIRDNQLELIDTNLFRGRASHDSGGRIYGGQVMAQSISAAQQSVDRQFVLHSMHAYFLRMGDPAKAVIYELEPIRDGRSYATRRIVAKQNGVAIYNCSLSFQVPEPGFDHQAKMPAVPAAETLTSDAELYQPLMPDGDYGWPMEFHQVAPMNFLAPQAMEPVSYTWFKTADPIADDPHLHQQLLAYASDNPILTTALRPHGVTHFSPGIMVATIDHALWFHRPFRVDEWLLYEVHSDSASGGRGLSRGKIFNQRGELVASACQEGVLRQRP